MDALRYQVDHGIASRAHLALWCLGYPDQAIDMSREALVLAQRSVHPLARAYALGFAAQVHHMRHEGQLAQALSEAMIALSREQGLTFWLAMATFRLGAALAHADFGVVAGSAAGLAAAAS